ncbi:MAG: DUF5362 domain-containing protein [Anaerolineales bacterium]|jgi:hypothetical protein|nr:DUF5362 domain-containing protein [Anaerolineales bacterium]
MNFSQSPESQVVRSVSSPLAEAAGWMKFLGLLSIIAGATQMLSLVGILWGWLPLWMGILLYQSASSVESARMTGDYHALASAMSNLKTYFIINGVITLLGIFISFLSICVLLVLPMLGIIPYLLDPSNF